LKTVLAATGKASVRWRELPAHVVAYYAIAIALPFLCRRCTFFQFNDIDWREMCLPPVCASLRLCVAWPAESSSAAGRSLPLGLPRQLATRPHTLAVQ